MQLLSADLYTLTEQEKLAFELLSSNNSTCPEGQLNILALHKALLNIELKLEVETVAMNGLLVDQGLIIWSPKAESDVQSADFDLCSTGCRA